MSKTIILIDTEELEHHIMYVNSKRTEFPPYSKEISPYSKEISLTLGDIIREYAILRAKLNRNGKWDIEEFVKGIPRSLHGVPTRGSIWEIANQDTDLINVFYKIASETGLLLEDPKGQHPICTCPTECDCADPENGLKNNSCQIHNDEPDPDPECPQHGNKLDT